MLLTCWYAFTPRALLQVFVISILLQFSSQPGRFSLSDIQEGNVVEGKSSEISNLRVNILANFDWGATTVETIHMSPISSLGLCGDHLKVCEETCFLVIHSLFS